MTGKTIVMSYAGACPEPTQRHLAHWRIRDWPVVVCSPADAACPEMDGVENFVVGNSEQFGKRMIDRFKAVFSHVLDESEWYLFLEYDALVLGDIPAPCFEEKGIWSNLRDNRHPHKYHADWFFHFPYLIDRETMQAIVANAHTIHSGQEDGFIDRWLGLLAQNLKLPFHDFGAYGHSRNTIEPCHIDDAIKAVKEGACMIHGCKTQECYDALIKARNGHE